MPDMTPEERKEFDRKLAVLSALAAVGKAQFEANPRPHLEEIYRKIYILRNAIDEATLHLTGVTSFDLAREHFPKLQPHFVETVTIRNRKAWEILTAALRKFHGYES